MGVGTKKILFGVFLFSAYVFCANFIDNSSDSKPNSEPTIHKIQKDRVPSSVLTGEEDIVVGSPTFDIGKDIQTKPVELKAIMDQNPKYLEQLEKVNLNIEGKKFSVKRKSYQSQTKDNITWVGVIEGQIDSRVIISFIKGYFSGSIQTHNDFYTVEYNDVKNQYQMTKISKAEMESDDILGNESARL